MDKGSVGHYNSGGHSQDHMNRSTATALYDVQSVLQPSARREHTEAHSSTYCYNVDLDSAAVSESKEERVQL